MGYTRSMNGQLDPDDRRVSNSVDPDRLSRTPLLPGGGSQQKRKLATEEIEVIQGPDTLGGASKTSTTGTGSDKNSTSDWRVRVSVANNKLFYMDTANAGVMEPLKSTNGVIFPYVPELTITYAARYNNATYTHSNYTGFFYEGSDVNAISISGDFVVQNRDDGLYLLACLYFFRAATKMFFGQNAADSGNPPPLLYLNGYGKHYLPNVPCVMTSFQHSMPPDVDYIEVYPKNNTTAVSNSKGTGSINSGANYTRLPTNSRISITVQPTYSRKRTTQFDLRKFAAGELLSEPGKFGGFL